MAKVQRTHVARNVLSQPQMLALLARLQPVCWLLHRNCKRMRRALQTLPPPKGIAGVASVSASSQDIVSRAPALGGASGDLLQHRRAPVIEGAHRCKDARSIAQRRARARLGTGNSERSEPCGVTESDIRATVGAARGAIGGSGSATNAEQLLRKMIDNHSLRVRRLSALHESDSAAVHGRGGADKGDIAALIDAANSCTPFTAQPLVRPAKVPSLGLARRCGRSRRSICKIWCPR